MDTKEQGYSGRLGNELSHRQRISKLNLGKQSPTVFDRSPKSVRERAHMMAERNRVTGRKPDDVSVFPG